MQQRPYGPQGFKIFSTLAFSEEVCSAILRGLLNYQAAEARPTNGAISSLDPTWSLQPFLPFSIWAREVVLGVEYAAFKPKEPHQVLCFLHGGRNNNSSFTFYGTSQHTLDHWKMYLCGRPLHLMVCVLPQEAYYPTNISRVLAPSCSCSPIIMLSVEWINMMSFSIFRWF